MKSKFTGLGLLCAGLIGAGLRLWTRKTAYETSTNLTISGSISLTILIAYAIAIPLLALAFAIILEKKSPASATSIPVSPDPWAVWELQRP